MLTRDLFAVAS